MIDGVLYAPDAVGLVEAFDAGDGQDALGAEALRADAQGGGRARARAASICWRSGSERRIVSMRGQYLYELDARTGAPISSFGDRRSRLAEPPHARTMRRSSAGMVRSSSAMSSWSVAMAAACPARATATAALMPGRARKTSAASMCAPASSCGSSTCQGRYLGQGLGRARRQHGRLGAAVGG